jgi:hypothetical protein
MNFPFAANGVATGDCDNNGAPTQSRGKVSLPRVRDSISYAVPPLHIEG